MLLGQVHQLEVQGERAQSQVALVRVEAGHRRQQLDVAAQPPVLTATARQLAQLIDHGHGLLALLFSQHLGEQVVNSVRSRARSGSILAPNLRVVSCRVTPGNVDDQSCR